MSHLSRLMAKVCKPIHLLVGVIALLPMLVGALVVNWHVERTLNKNVLRSTVDAIVQIDRILDEARETALSQIQLTGRGCSVAILHVLRSEVIPRPYVRSSFLARDNKVYCASYHGYHEDAEPLPDVEFPLSLRSDDPITPDRSTVMYSHRQGRFSSHVIVAGSTLAKPIRLLSPGVDNHIQIGQRWLDENAEVHDDDPSVGLESAQMTESATYGYQVSGGQSVGTIRATSQREFLDILGSLAMLSLLLGWSSSRLLGARSTALARAT